MNFPGNPNLTHLGCFRGPVLIWTKVIGDDLLSFPVVFTTEEVLAVKDGLQLREEQLNHLERSSSGIKAICSNLPMLSFGHPSLAPKTHRHRPHYKDHVREIKASSKQPLLFGMYSSNHRTRRSIVIPPMSKHDYDRTGVVIGRRARQVSDCRPDYIAGYTIINDVSARDFSSLMDSGCAQIFDTFALIGPYLVTRTTLGDGDGLDIELRLNGKTMQKSNTRNMISGA
jgi:2-keto-4-pentenoate hydratase/2-oxohepta-3-ene-1,7-dioic acid hydratase in catechol pathway